MRLLTIRSSRSPAAHSDIQHSALARAWLRHCCPSKSSVLNAAYLGVRANKMAKESSFVSVAQEVASNVLSAPLYVQRGASLLYQVMVDNQLSLTVDIRKPKRGNAAFQTDLCVFERKNEEVSIPRVVLEFKTRITTHDVLTYSAKATKHKQVYPYLRYGIVASNEKAVPGRLFNHNQALDFCLCCSGVVGEELRALFADLLTAEVKSSRDLESIAYGSVKAKWFRTEFVLGKL